MTSLTRRLVAGLALVVAAPTLVAANQDPGRPDDEWPTYGPTHYVAMSDGVKIALNARLPENYVAGQRYPTIMEMSGYESGSADGRTPAGDIADETGIEQLPLQGGTRATHGGFHDDEYVTVMVSLRGSGCSGGEFDLFSWRSALDGRELIDDWIANQEWSNGDVGIFGHSYSGITGTMMAATQPEHLQAVSVSGLLGDLYRDIVYPGGVTNYGFPLLWTGAVRPVYDLGGGIGGGLIGPVDEMGPEATQRCLEAQQTKSRTVLQDPLVQAVWDQDNEWFRARSNWYVADRIDVPFHITTAYQDEQTGPRGAHTVWDGLPDDISKRIVLTNGNHDTQDYLDIRNDGLAWLDYWLLDRDHPQDRHATSFPGGEQADLTEVFGRRDVVTTTSRLFLDYRAPHSNSFAGQIQSTDWPLPETGWTDVALSADGSIVTDAASVQAGTVSYFSGSRRQAYAYQTGVNEGGEISSSDGPDEAEFAMAITEPTVVAGPMTATLFLDATAVDTDVFVQVIDRAPTGELLYLQRGTLRASHRAISNQFTRTTDDGRIWRPFRPHTNPQLVGTPGEVMELLVEIWPVGHIFRPGHELVVRVSAPPLDDNDWIYLQKVAPSWNTIHVGGDTPSRLMLPLIPLADVEGLNLDHGPCEYNQMRCVTPGHTD